MKKLLLLLAAGAALAGCKDTTYLEPADAGTGYFPAAVGQFRTYQVIDTTWLNYSYTVRRYQARERLTGTYPDAAGQPVFRVELARRAAPADAWVPDSVFSLSADARRVVYSRGNRRRVELVFPLREAAAWNQNAYANTTRDTVTAETRRYVPGTNGQPFTTPALPGLPARRFAQTLTTASYGPADIDDNCSRLRSTQVFALGIGPVYRRAVSFIFQDGGSICDPQRGPFNGSSHTEILLESGP